jgi:hypothetical protein
MADRDLWEERRRSYESEYFQRRERELIEKMRQRAAREAERQDLAEQVGAVDDEILAALHDLGYSRDTVMLLHLVPLLQVAWVDGSVSAEERAGILDAARLRGVEEGSPAHRQLLGWLDRRPPEGFFEDTVRLIGHLLQVQTPDQQAKTRQDLLSYANAIASASGGILGFGSKVSADEQAVIDRLAREIEGAHGAAARGVLK